MVKGPILIVLAACLVTLANAAGAEEVTLANFAALTKGKNAFVKFLAPW
jgi:hypothetical protein